MVGGVQLFWSIDTEVLPVNESKTKSFPPPLQTTESIRSNQIVPESCLRWSEEKFVFMHNQVVKVMTQRTSGE